MFHFITHVCKGFLQLALLVCLKAVSPRGPTPHTTYVLLLVGSIVLSHVESSSETEQNYSNVIVILYNFFYSLVMKGFLNEIHWTPLSLTPPKTVTSSVHDPLLSRASGQAPAPLRHCRIISITSLSYSRQDQGKNAQG